MNNLYILFRILTKVSNASSEFDVWGFSVAEGGNIVQWDYAGGVNQLWRFNGIDSIALDTISADTFDIVGLRSKELSSLLVFPNRAKMEISLSTYRTY